MTQIDVTFSGAVNGAQADKTRVYRLAYARQTGSTTAKNAGGVKLRSAKYNTATEQRDTDADEAARAQGPGRCSS